MSKTILKQPVKQFIVIFLIYIIGVLLFNKNEFYFFTYRKIAQKTKSKKKNKLKKISAGYIEKLYKNLAQNVNSAVGHEFYGRVATDTTMSMEDIQKYLLATSDNGRGMQDDINLYVTRDRLNNASFRQKLDPIARNIFQRQNPLELAFKDISAFNAQNPIAG